MPGCGVSLLAVATRSAPVGGEMRYPAAARIYASSVAANGIPIGNDTTGDGSRGNPYLTLAKAYTAAVDGKVLLINGDPAAPTDYRSATVYNWTKAVTLDSVVPFGGQISATTTTSRVLLLNPASGATVAVASVIIDGQGANPYGIEVSTAPTAAWTANISARIRNVTNNGVFSSSSVVSHCNVILNADIQLSGARACVDLTKMGADASVTVTGGTYASMTAGYGYRAFRCWAAAQGAVVSILGGTFTRSAGTGGASNDTAVELQDVLTTVRNATINAFDPTGLAAGLKALTIAPSTSGAALDMSSFEVSGCTINIDTKNGGGGIWVGYDATGTAPYTQADGKLNNGSIFRNQVLGTAQTATSGTHGIFVSCQSNAKVYRNLVKSMAIGGVAKGAAGSLWYSNIFDSCTSSYMLAKGTAGDKFLHNTIIASAGFGGSGIDIEVNPTSGANSTLIAYIGNLFVYQGVNPRFVNVDAGQTIAAAGYNDYYASSGLGSLPFVYLGTTYTSLAAYQAASGEVGPVSVNPALSGYVPTNAAITIVPADANVTTDFNGAAFPSPAPTGAVRLAA